jgi:hypothetical protein
MILRKICVDNKDLNPLLIGYSIVSYSYLISLALFLIVLIIKVTSI